MARNGDEYEQIGTVWRKKPKPPDNSGGWLVALVLFFLFFWVIGSVTGGGKPVQQPASYQQATIQE